ncbi:MAG: hypothetical protein LWW75_10035, partial [Chlorobiales bacterium]|nr:hypothetical protein [Chlorobiales bacterium]
MGIRLMELDLRLSADIERLPVQDRPVGRLHDIHGRPRPGYGRLPGNELFPGGQFSGKHHIASRNI